MKSYKGRTIESGQRVDCYRNLHTGGFSIRDAKTGKVLGHANTVLLEDCRCFVSKRGREITIKEKRKRVHAYIRGYYIYSDLPLYEELNVEVVYNPYLHEHFIQKKTGCPVFQLEKAFFAGVSVLTKNIEGELV